MNKNIKLNNSYFQTAIFDMKQINFLKKKQIIFVGKSNVGKSSIINKITNTKIAKTANYPGKTKSINVYNIDNKCYIIDLPGFGYANVSSQIKNNWKNLIEQFFFINMKNIKLFIYVVDVRREFNENDFIMIKYLENTKIPYLILLNKCDKLKKINDDIIIDFKKKLSYKFIDNILLFSIKSSKYINNFLKFFYNTLNSKEGD